MADQVSASLSLNVSSSLLQESKNWSFTDTLALQAKAAGIQTVTTDYADLTIGDMASTDLGLSVLHNLDSANYVNYGSSAGEFQIDPGEIGFARITPGKTIRIKANTANVKVAKYILGK